jgi:acylphosphatase
VVLNERLDATVRGYVQGVGFRWFVVREAARLGLTGWTANEPDGSVRVVVEGPPQLLDAMLDSLRDGPPAAQVESVSVQRGPAGGHFSSFEVRAGGHTGD